MKRHKLLNNRNEKLFNRLLENQGLEHKSSVKEERTDENYTTEEEVTEDEVSEGIVAMHCPKCDCLNRKTNKHCTACGAMIREEVKEAAKPDFLDLDKDGDKEEPMADAAEDAKDKKEDK
tara:strand:+ start:3219 stop:3578 length:360 start_codon:yes stop_codon:yes gene_type:complete